MSKLLNDLIFTNVNSSNKIFTPHFHNTYSIGITHKGLYKSKNRNNTFNFYERSTRINNPNEVHEGTSNSWDNHYIYPSIELLSEIYFQIFNEKKTPIFNQHIIEDEILYKKLYLLFYSYFNKKDTLIIETYLIDTLSYLVKKHSHTHKISEDYNNSAIVTRSLEYINDNLDINIELDELARNVSLSKYHFLRMFKKELLLTPHQYILNKRVEKAKSLIQNGFSISNAAIEVGFNDQSHFNRNFKRYYDYLPSQILNNRNFILY